MREVQARDRGGRGHRVALGQRHAVMRGVVEEREQSALGRVVRARRVAERRANAAVLLREDVLARQVLRHAIAEVFASLVVQVLRRGLGEAVGEGLGHDRVVVVVLPLELAGELVGAVPGGDDERAEVVDRAAVAGRRDVIGEREAHVLGLLLPHHREPRELARAVADRDVLTVRARAPEPVSRPRAQQPARLPHAPFQRRLQPTSRRVPADDRLPPHGPDGPGPSPRRNAPSSHGGRMGMADHRGRQPCDRSRR